MGPDYGFVICKVAARAFGIGREQTLASMERFGYDVIPQLGNLVNVRQAA